MDRNALHVPPIHPKRRPKPATAVSFANLLSNQKGQCRKSGASLAGLAEEMKNCKGVGHDVEELGNVYSPPGRGGEAAHQENIAKGILLKARTGWSAQNDHPVRAFNKDAFGNIF